MANDHALIAHIDDMKIPSETKSLTSTEKLRASSSSENTSAMYDNVSDSVFKQLKTLKLFQHYTQTITN